MLIVFMMFVVNLVTIATGLNLCHAVESNEYDKESTIR